MLGSHMHTEFTKFLACVKEYTHQIKYTHVLSTQRRQNKHINSPLLLHTLYYKFNANMNDMMHTNTRYMYMSQ